MLVSTHGAAHILCADAAVIRLAGDTDSHNDPLLNRYFCRCVCVRGAVAATAVTSTTNS
jgi:hypothetical protein